MDKKVNLLAGRAADLQAYATSDLSVGEQLAGGASVDDLVAAGVLYDDYAPEGDPDYSFTPLEPLPDLPDGPPVPEEILTARVNASLRCNRMAEEYRKNMPIQEWS